MTAKIPREAIRTGHEKLGEGTIGKEALVRILNHPRLRGIPVYLETPNELPGYAGEIAFLKQAFQGGEDH